jgi:hypothetical protein
MYQTEMSAGPGQLLVVYEGDDWGQVLVAFVLFRWFGEDARRGSALGARARALRLWARGVRERADRGALRRSYAASTTADPGM